MALVLIETLWNVKKYDPLTMEELDVVLIETLWNVKQQNRLRKALQQVSGINRNIVECKENTLVAHEAAQGGII